VSTPVLRAAALAAPHRARLALSAVLGAAAVGAALGLLATSGYLIVHAAQRPAILELTMAIVAVRAFGISRAVLRYFERLASHDVAFRILADLRRTFFTRLVPRVPGGLRPGDLLTRFVADVDTLQDLYLRALTPPVVAAAVIAVAGGAAYAVQPAAGLTLAGGLLVAALALPAATHLAARAAARRQAPARAALSSELVEALDGAAELAVLGQGPRRLDRLARADAALVHTVRRDALAGGLAAGLGTLLTGATVVGVLAVALAGVAAGRVPGVLLGFVVLLALAAFEGVAPLPAAAQHLARCAAAARRIAAVTDAPVAVTDPLAPLPVPAGLALEASGVRVAGDDPSRPRLDGVDLRLARGRAIAVVGPSGAGKTTLAGLLVRFADPEAGCVTLDGVDVRALEQDALRGRVLLVAQDAYLFTTTIRDNLRLARPGATDEELRAAMAAVGLGPWVAQLPSGLDTPVGEDGDALSGGQRRRLLVARALISGAPLLVLDEPAAHLDPPAVRALHERLRAEAGDRGVLVIAHAVAGLEGYDEIMVMHNGRVVERGTHAELVARGGRYARTVASQPA
jgi:thiol reductant ABC exporter CydC subunit